MTTQESLEKVLSNFFLLVSCIVILGPLFFVFNVSLKTNRDWLRSPMTISNTLYIENYKNAWVKAEMSTHFRNSIIYSVSSALGTCLIGIIAAYPISREHFKGARLAYIIFILGLFLPLGLVPTVFIMKYLGLTNTYYGYILLCIGLNLPFAIFIFVGFIKSIPVELDESAAIDGCGYIRYIFTILIPLMKPSITTVALFTMINVWNDFINPFLYLTDKSMRPLTSGLYVFQGQYSTEWTSLASAMIIIITPLLIIFLFTQKFLVSGLTLGAIKE